jgi:hypothetical protein
MVPAKDTPMTEPKRRRTAARAPQEPSSSTASPRASRRKAAEFSVPIKLWVSDEMYAELEAAASEREWSVPQVIRRMVKIVLGARTLG